MGIFYDYSIEYLIKLKNGEYIKVVSSQESEDRLVNSNYYKKNQDSIFNAKKLYNLLLAPKLIHIHDFDIFLTDKEKNKLGELLKLHEYIEHGWYEVSSMTTTY